MKRSELKELINEVKQELTEGGLKSDNESIKKIINFLKAIGFKDATEKNAKLFVGQYGLLNALLKELK